MYADLPKQVQEQTRKAYLQFKQDSSYPSLRFKKIHPTLPIYSARINKNYRAVGQLEGDTRLTDKTFCLAVETAATRTKSAYADCWNP
jgi:hypothetical protein